MIVLASKSPRRKELLESMGYKFEIKVSEVDETLEKNVHPRQGVEILARRKAEAVAPLSNADDVIIASDTLVELDGAPLGKPRDKREALKMLMSLSGRSHNVHTGVAVMSGNRIISAVDTSTVYFRPFDEIEALEYVKTGEPMDKAGAYGIQGLGAKLVDRYIGEIDTIIGLPRKCVKSLMKRIENPSKRERATEIVSILKEKYPFAPCALEYGGDPWKLLVMGRLSAQCTDARVNIVCRDLFRKYPTARDMAGANIEELEEYVKPCGLYRVKARDIKNESLMLTEKFDGVLPDDMDTLLGFPGVGRKIANLLLGDIYKKPAVVTDTHCIRICGRMGFYPEKETTPYKIEKILSKLISPAEQSDFCHRIVMFGRDICSARAPKCDVCPIADKGLCMHKSRGDCKNRNKKKRK